MKYRLTNGKKNETKLKLKVIKVVKQFSMCDDLTYQEQCWKNGKKKWKVY